MAESYSTVTGTAGNDILFFQGEVTTLNMMLTNAYSGETLTIDDEYNLNTASYEGMAGIDILFLSNTGDALFLTNDNGSQLISGIERVFAGDGGDVIALDSTEVTLGDIFIDGGRAGDILWSNSGNDTLRGFDGDDILHGGPGDDTLLGQNQNDILNGGTGDDRLDGGQHSDLLYGDAGDDTLVFFQDTIYDSSVTAVNDGSGGTGGTGESVNADGYKGSFDVFDGGDGYDTLEMTSGDDAFFLVNSDHPIHPGAETDVRLADIEEIRAGAGDDIIDLTSDNHDYGDINMFGEAGNDTLWASAGEDMLDGGDGADDLYGGTGHDTLYGGNGNDVLTGGPGQDTAGVFDIEILSHDFTNTVLFPDLQERVDIMDLVPSGENALGIAAGDLSVDFATTADVSFVETGAGFNNSLGFYNIALDGTIQAVELAFPNVKDFNVGDTATIDLPGAPDTDFGFFTIANGARKNRDFDHLDLENGAFEFVYDYGGAGERLANISDHENDISLVFSDGSSEQVIVGSNNHIYHTTLRDGPTDLNSDGATHVVSGVMDGSDAGTLRVGFEDLPNLGDADYNDVVFDITVHDQTIQTLAVEDNDVLYGGAGDDTIDGGVGDDILFGGEGADTLYGGHGADQFVFDVLDGMADTVKDFASGEDILNITDVLNGYDPLTDAINDFVQMTQSGADTEIAVNADGAADGVFTAVAIIEGGVGGETLAGLIDQGAFVADQAVVV